MPCCLPTVAFLDHWLTYSFCGTESNPTVCAAYADLRCWLTGTFQPWAAALGGIAGGLIYYPSSLFFLHVLKIDDVVDAGTVWPTSLIYALLDACPAKN